LKQKYINAYMQTAQVFAELSHARRLHVGAIVVKEDRIVSIGYNGMPAGWDNNCEDEIGHVFDDIGHVVETRLKTKPEVLHAEMNALMKLAKSTESGNGADLFITHAPCLDCAKGIFQAGIARVWFGAAYRDTTGIDFLKKSNIQVTQHDSSKI
jgi:dCMP deaminase